MPLFHIRILYLASFLGAVFFTGSRAVAQPVGGEVDPGFGVNGRSIATLAGFSTQAFACDRQSDGKLVVVGQAWDGATTYQMAVARFNTDGSLDTGFGSSGFALYGPAAGLTYAARGVKVLSDGNILVVGDASNRVLLVRFLATGQRDLTFAVNSELIGENARATALAVQENGKILVCANGIETGRPENTGYVLCFSALGTLDLSYGVLGRYVQTGSWWVSTTAVAILALPGGKSLHVGSSDGRLSLTYLTASGQRDPAFRNGALLTLSFGSSSVKSVAKAVAIDADGNAVVVGQIKDSGIDDIVLARVTPAGLLDATFSDDGWLRTNFGISGVASGLVVQTDGNLLISGHSNSVAGTSFVVRRYQWSGIADNAFDDDGLVATSVGVSAVETAGMLLQEDGKIVVAGTAVDSGGSGSPGLALVRYEPGVALTRPVFTKQLEDMTVPVNSPVSLSVMAEANGPLTYSWFRGDTLLRRGPSPTYSIADAYYHHEGVYKVEVRSGGYAVWSSTATFKVSSPPKIGEQGDRALKRLVGYGVYLWVEVSGRPPMTYKWFKGQTEISRYTANLTQGVTGFPIETLKMEDTGSYHFEVSNSDGVVLSQEYELLVVRDPSVEVLLADGHILDLGEPYLLEAKHYNSTDFRLQWNRRGKAIAKAVDRFYPIESAALTDAGAYTLAIRSSKGSFTSAPVQLAVCDRSAGSHIAAHNKKYVITVPVAGNGLKCQWYKGDKAVDNDGRVSGADSPALSFKKIEAGDVGEYTCRVSGYGMEKISGIQQLQVAADVPTLAGLALPGAHIGLAYSHAPILPDLATHFEFTGLPAGFSYSKADNRVTGKPTKAGTFQVKVLAVNPVGKSAPLTVPLVVVGLPEGMEGRYYAQAGEGDRRGFMDLTLAATGAYSGKLFLCDLQGKTSTTTFTGAININNGPAGVNPLPESFATEAGIRLLGFYPKSSPGLMSLRFSPNHCEGEIRMMYMLEGSETEAYVGIYLASCPWTAKKPLAAKYAGQFNLALSSRGEPQGSGVAKALVTVAGALSMAGKLPDGTGVTCSAPVNFEFDAWEMAFLYGNRGVLNGMVTVKPGEAGTEFLETFTSGELDWQKSAHAASVANYPQGFSTSVVIEGGTKYLPPKIPPMTGPLMMGTGEGTGNVYVEVNAVGVNATLERSHTVKFGKGPDENPLAISGLTFNAAQGTFTASSSYSYKETLYDEQGKPHLVTLTKPFTMQGIVVRSPTGSSAYALGFARVPSAYALNRFTNVPVPVAVWPTK
jgi:uncharacterized delta-60 repeat protein